jgi:pimeloyl-ACP methyl ester carboxylesterase
MVMANGIATVYRRWGSGRTVVLLGVSEAIAAALGGSFRVIVPELPPGLSDGGAARWLSGVSEGLGIAEAVIVAAPAWREGASQFAHDAPDRVRHVIIVEAAARDATGVRAAVESAFS